jgi:hypothetical protein
MSSDNRYAAPQANVDKPESTSERWSRPPPIVIGSVTCLALVLILVSAWPLIMMFGAVRVGELPVGALVVPVAVIAIRAWLLIYVLRARNWARIVLLAFAVIGVFLEVQRWRMVFRLVRVDIVGVLSVQRYALWAGAAIELIAAALLFVPSASRWFRERKAARLA